MKLSGANGVMQITRTILSVVQPQSRKIYDLRWSFFVKWCGKHKLFSATVSVLRVLKLLNKLASSGEATNFVEDYLTALSMRHVRVKLGRR